MHLLKDLVLEYPAGQSSPRNFAPRVLLHPDKSENLLESQDKCLGGNSKFLILNLSHNFLFFMTGFMV